MTIKDMFLEKIEKEYDNFYDMVGDYEIEDIIDNAWYIAVFKSVYEYFKCNEPLNDEQMAHFLKIDEAMQLIANRYTPLKEDMHSSFNTICEDITENKLYASRTSPKANELLSRMSEEVEILPKEGIEIEKKSIFEYFIKIAHNIDDYLADSLMQFEKPLEVICEVARKNSDLSEIINNTISYIENNDIFTLPHSLNHEKILNESRWRHDAIAEITSIIPKPDFKVTMSWIDFFRTVNDEYEGFEGNPYIGYVDALKTISANQGVEILQQLYDMEKDTMMLDNELIEAAKYLADGGDYKQIESLSDCGFFQISYEKAKEMFKNDIQEGGIGLC